MTVQSRPLIVEIVPEGAPFTAEQRMWLNGFFTGVLSIDGSGAKPLSAAEAAVLLPGAPPRSPFRRLGMATTARPGTTRACRSPSA
jgi:sulfite reductase (NADPH) flavoprotein alpha-component